MNLYVYVEDLAFGKVEIDRKSLCITNSEEEAYAFFINLRPYYIELWEEGHGEGSYENLSLAEKNSLNKKILNDNGSIHKVPVTSITGINLVK